ncbi:hypothetical protein BDV59DRAFT_203123 [Aspergillus ambiguus]|uniref:uncharacterized protein n=1 Tax=Aspergillus ambiguus TaxID=176160 RepID=UPI003CCCA3DF
MEKIYRSAIPPYEVPEGMSLHQFMIAYNPDLVADDKTILEDLGFPYKKLTYGGLRTQAAVGAAALKQRYNLSTGDTAVIYSTNSVDYALFAHSTMWAGCVIANQVAPSELEGILGSHPKIIEAAVCGYFDSERQTEWPIGYAVLSPSVPEADRRTTLDEILTWVNGQVASYKQLRGGLHYIDTLPKNPTGKLQRNQLPIKLDEQRKPKL